MTSMIFLNYEGISVCPCNRIFGLIVSNARTEGSHPSRLAFYLPINVIFLDCVNSVQHVRRICQEEILEGKKEIF